MPTYGYQCGRCAHKFEVRQSMSDAPLKDCPECGGELRKLLYPVGVQFKGSGFYTTDYRSKSNGEGGDKSGDKGDGKSDGSKTATKGSDKGSDKGSESSSSSSSNGSESGSSSSGSSEKKTTEPAASKE
jgi:putative FmdB family regulatory protein